MAVILSIWPLERNSTTSSRLPKAAIVTKLVPLHSNGPLPRTAQRAKKDSTLVKLRAVSALPNAPPPR
jgi:hypothetical protein